ncbi:MAG: ATP-binding protein [Actinomycetota bacterium]
MPADITVTVPARPEFVHVLRTVVASVASRLDLGYDAIDELRIVVDEACGLLLRLPSAGPVLFLRASLEKDSVELTACLEAEPDDWPAPRAEQGLAWRVLAGLTDEATFVRWDGRPAVRVSKRIEPVGVR